MGLLLQVPFALERMGRSQLFVNWHYLVKLAGLFPWKSFYTILMFATVMPRSPRLCEAFTL